MKVVTGFLPLDFIEKQEENRVSAVHNYKENLSKAGKFSANSSVADIKEKKKVRFQLTTE